MTTTRRHNRKLGLLGADLVVVKFKVDRVRLMTEVRDDVEQWMVESGFLEGAPFEWITLCLRSGLKSDKVPLYGPISKKYADLPMSIELDVGSLQAEGEEQVKRALLIATLTALSHAGHKFGLNGGQIDQKLVALSPA